MTEEPIAWRWSGIPGAAVRLTGPTDLTPYVVDFTGETARAEAEAYKATKREQGWVGSVTPVYVNKGTRTKARNKTQQRTADKGFNADWRLHGDAT